MSSAISLTITGSKSVKEVIEILSFTKHIVYCCVMFFYEKSDIGSGF